LVHASVDSAAPRGEYLGFGVDINEQQLDFVEHVESAQFLVDVQALVLLEPLDFVDVHEALADLEFGLAHHFAHAVALLVHVLVFYAAEPVEAVELLLHDESGHDVDVAEAVVVLVVEDVRVQQLVHVGLPLVAQHAHDARVHVDLDLLPDQVDLLAGQHHVLVDLGRDGRVGRLVVLADLALLAAHHAGQHEQQLLLQVVVVRVARLLTLLGGLHYPLLPQNAVHRGVFVRAQDIGLLLVLIFEYGLHEIRVEPVFAHELDEEQQLLVGQLLVAH